ncbi:MAG: tripartite tricarboxylate transporter substrate binding protein [Betaproteobacteria bacterium]|nr:MAG: tripartite tricarboxylate transporter substrate binding protein [Betaproteobacteria bacterium]
MWKRVVSLTIALLGAAQAFAQFPDKNINYIIPFPAGGESDVAARQQGIIARKMTGKDFIVQNKAGAGGALVWNTINREAADGYTVAGVNLPHLVLQPMEGNVQYKTDDIASVYWFHFTPDAIVVPVESKYKTLADLIADAKANPGKLNVGGSALNSANHAAAVRFENLAGVKFTYVPFKGTADMATAILGKHVDAAMSYTTFAIAQKEKVRLLAVATEKRHPLFPNAPTFKEAGFNWVDGAYRGVAVPKATPDAVKKQVSDLFAKINADPDMKKQMADGGFEWIDVPLDRVNAFMDERKKAYTEAAKLLGLAK